MSNIVFGYTSATVGALYLVLAAQVLAELRTNRGALAFGFIGAFTTCALHHLFHAHHLLISEVAADVPEGLAMIASTLPAAAYVRLRFNAAIGLARNGDERATKVLSQMLDPDNDEDVVQAALICPGECIFIEVEPSDQERPLLAAASRR